MWIYLVTISEFSALSHQFPVCYCSVKYKFVILDLLLFFSSFVFRDKKSIIILEGMGKNDSHDTKIVIVQWINECATNNRSDCEYLTKRKINSNLFHFEWKKSEIGYEYRTKQKTKFIIIEHQYRWRTCKGTAR